MKRLLLSLFFFFQVCISSGQQFALYNTRTLFDAFENPSQKAFYADSSKKYAFNFFIPSFSVSTQVEGPAQATFKKMFYTGTLDANNLTLGGGLLNHLYVSENTYLAMYRIFKKVNIHAEHGFSWQIKTDVRAAISNETLAILHNYKIFNEPTPYINALNNKISGTSYHQISYSYRDNYSKKLGLGLKLSYLSGIAYSSLSMNESSLEVDKVQNTYRVSLDGTYRSNFLLYQPDGKIIMPGFKNPGAALTLSANYKARGGWYILANLKDLGFIRWADQPYTYRFAKTLTFNATPGSGNTKLDQKLEDELLTSPERKSFLTPINGKAEVLINKDFGSYQPNLLLTKNAFNNGGHIALINRYQHKALNFSLLNAYSLNKYFMTGGQFMVKSPNAEFYLGSDQLFKTYYFTKGIITTNEKIGKGNPAASVYMGFSLKFGRVMERWQNASYIPMDDQNEGLFKRLSKRLFGKKGAGKNGRE